MAETTNDNIQSIQVVHKSIYILPAKGFAAWLLASFLFVLLQLAWINVSQNVITTSNTLKTTSTGLTLGIILLLMIYSLALLYIVLNWISECYIVEP